MVCVPAPVLVRSPRKARAGGTGGGDVFGFAGGDATEALTRNWWALMALPWAAVWALQSELLEESLRHMGR